MSTATASRQIDWIVFAKHWCGPPEAKKLIVKASDPVGAWDAARLLLLRFRPEPGIHVPGKTAAAMSEWLSTRPAGAVPEGVRCVPYKEHLQARQTAAQQEAVERERIRTAEADHQLTMRELLSRLVRLEEQRQKGGGA